MNHHSLFRTTIHFNKGLGFMSSYLPKEKGHAAVAGMTLSAMARRVSYGVIVIRSLIRSKLLLERPAFETSSSLLL